MQCHLGELDGPARALFGPTSHPCSLPHGGGRSFSQPRPMQVAAQVIGHLPLIESVLPCDKIGEVRHIVFRSATAGSDRGGIGIFGRARERRGDGCIIRHGFEIFQILVGVRKREAMRIPVTFQEHNP